MVRVGGTMKRVRHFSNSFFLMEGAKDLLLRYIRLEKKGKDNTKPKTLKGRG
jgi:hypothetical protein